MAGSTTRTSGHAPGFATEHPADVPLPAEEPYEDYVRRHMGELLRIVTKVAAGDFSEKPQLVANDDELSKFIVGFRWMIEDLETGHREAQRTRLALERANEELRYRKTLLESQNDAAVEGILVVSPEGGILSFNRRFIEMWGIPPEVVESRSDARALASVLDRLEDPAGFLSRVRELYDHPEQESKDELALKDGRTFERHTSPVRSVDGVLYGRAWYFRDVTDRKRTEKELRVLNTELAEVARSRAQILNTASHELNTPLTPLVIQLHLLRAGTLGPLNARQMRATDILFRNVDRLSLLVRDLLDVARLQSGRLNLRKEPTAVDALVREACESFHEPARAAGVTLRVDASTGALLEVDPTRVTQVVFNLVSNALKFTPPGGGIAVAARRAGDGVAVSVADSGVGLTAAQIGRLFQAFSQVHDGSEGGPSGTGLGLYISRGIVEQHGGTISCTSGGPGRGSVFTFTLRG